jgi:plasmid replication initiation protein
MTTDKKASKKVAKTATKGKAKKASPTITLVRKANELVEARYRFDIWETRIFLEMLTKISYDDTGFTDYKIYLRDFVKDFFLQDNKNTYRLAKEASKKLMGKLIEAKINRSDGKTEDFITPVVTSFKGRDEDSEEASYIKLSFHPEMRPFLLELRERYLTYEFRNVANLSSPYYVRIYELLKQYEKIGKRSFNVEALKAMLGITSEYKSYGHFKNKIIDKARVSLVKFTDIKFEYEEITNGSRKVTDLIFYISRNVPENRPERAGMALQSPKIQEKPIPTLFSDPAPYEKLPTTSQEDSSNRVEPLKEAWLDTYADALRERWGVSPSSFILKAQGKSETDVKKAIAFAEERIQLGKANNPAGVFLDALEKGHSSTKFLQIEQQTRKRDAVAMKQQQIEELEKEKAQLTKAYENRMNNSVRSIVQNDPSVSDRAINELKAMFNHLRDRTIDDFRNDTILRGMVIGRIRLMFPIEFADLKNDEQALRQISMEIENLKR